MCCGRKCCFIPGLCFFRRNGRHRKWKPFDRLLLRYLLPRNISEAQVRNLQCVLQDIHPDDLVCPGLSFCRRTFLFCTGKRKRRKTGLFQDHGFFYHHSVFHFPAYNVQLNLDDGFIRLIGPKFRVGKNVIPILLMANLFLGVYYTCRSGTSSPPKPIWGAWLSVIGAVITLALNFWWIPLSPDHLIYGYLGSAWATFICYGAMMILSYVIGQKIFPGTL